MGKFEKIKIKKIRDRIDLFFLFSKYKTLVHANETERKKINKWIKEVLIFHCREGKKKGGGGSNCDSVKYREKKKKEEQG